MTDYYKILEINRNADISEVKKAYHKLALKWHPDKNKSPEATEMFKNIGIAYNVLSDPEKKRKYDLYGKDDVENINTQFNVFDMFNQVFGKNFFQAQPTRTQTTTYDTIINEKITLNEVINGKTINKKISRQSLCDQCDGMGCIGNEYTTCSTCFGNKIIVQEIKNNFFTLINRIQCPTCHGRGSIMKNICSKCNGNKLVSETVMINLQIPIGSIDGDIITLKNAGDVNLNTSVRNDVLIKIIVEPHEVFLRNIVIHTNDKTVTIDKYNVLLKLKISLAESLCGFTKHIDFFGKDIKFSIDEITKNDDVFVIKNLGIPNGKSFGDIYVMILIDYPQKLDEKVKKLIWNVLSDVPCIEK